MNNNENISKKKKKTDFAPTYKYDTYFVKSFRGAHVCAVVLLLCAILSDLPRSPHI